MVLELAEFSAPDKDYVAKLNGNFDSIESEFTALKAIVTATSGPGSVLLLDIFDRPGIVGSSSYRLDVESYAGGASIDIGRRPAPFAPPGETDVSTAWGLFSGSWDRVQQTGDLTLNATGLAVGTIYVGVPSTGIATLYEDGGTPNVVMLYSMSWDDVDLTDFKRLAHLLPGYSLLQAIAAAPRREQILDGETNFVDGVTYSDSAIVVPGAPAANGISLEGAIELLGIHFDVQRDDEDAWYTNSAGDPDESKVTLQVVDQDDVEYCSTDIVIDCDDPIGTVFKALDAGLGDLKFVTNVRTLRLKVVSVGADVVCARLFTWGIFYRPLLGAPMPKDATKVRMI